MSVFLLDYLPTFSAFPAAISPAAMTGIAGLSATGFLPATLGRWQAAVGRMRVFFVMATVVGTGHNLLAGLAFGLVSDAMGLCGHRVILWRAGMFIGPILRQSPAAHSLSQASA